MHENYVVPADKAANNVIVVCKKYYLDVMLKELESTNTYQEVHSDCSNVVSRHLKYMVQNDIFVQEQKALKCKPSAEILEHLDWKHQFAAYVLGIYRTSFQHNLHCFIDACVHVVNDYIVSNKPV